MLEEAIEHYLASRYGAKKVASFDLEHNGPNLQR